MLGVPLSSPYGLGFAVNSFLCGVCQLLRADNDRLSRRLYVRAGRLFSERLAFARFAWAIEVGFMATENALFFVFLFGMTSGLAVGSPSH